MTESGTPSGESGELSLQGAADAFNALLNPQAAEEPTPEVDTEIDPPKKKGEAEAEPEPDPEGVEEGADAPITFEVDGKQVSLTKAELAEHYKNGLRQGDYTQKTMAVAEQRKAAEAETLKAQQERQTYQQNLGKMAAQLEGALEETAKIDWDALIANDPHEALKQQHLLQKRQAALQQNYAEQRRVAAQTQAEQAEALKSHIESQQQALLAKLPDWKDPAKASTEREAIKAYLMKEGYDEKDALGITDHKAVVLSRKAMLYDQMMAKASAAAKKVANLPTKVERPGAVTERNPMDGRTSAMRRHEKEGSIESLTAAFNQILRPT